MSEETLNKLLESIDNALWDLKHNKCNVDTEEKDWKTYYGLDDNLIKYIRKLEIRVEQLENIRKEAIKYILKNKLYRFKYDDEELFEITTDKKAKDDLLNILNKGSDKE